MLIQGIVTAFNLVNEGLSSIRLQVATEGGTSVEVILSAPKAVLIPLAGAETLTLTIEANGG